MSRKISEVGVKNLCCLIRRLTVSYLSFSEQATISLQHLIQFIRN